MNYFEDKNEKPNSMLGLLIDQFDHLEKLMGLMRKQIDSLKQDDADDLSGIINEREELNRKLDISQSEISRKML
jgi:hypothetical protein